MKILFSCLLSFSVLLTPAVAEPVPDKLRKPDLLDLGSGTKHELVTKAVVDSVTYYLIEQRPPKGDWSYILIRQVDGKEPQFVANGVPSYVLGRKLPPKAADVLAEAYVAREQGSIKSRNVVTAKAQAEYDNEKASFPPALRRAYEARGFR